MCYLRCCVCPHKILCTDWFQNSTFRFSTSASLLHVFRDHFQNTCFPFFLLYHSYDKQKQNSGIIKRECISLGTELSVGTFVYDFFIPLMTPLGVRMSRDDCMTECVHTLITLSHTLITLSVTLITLSDIPTSCLVIY